MNKIKYITYEQNDSSYGLIFPEHISHDKFARMINVKESSILGAGFLFIKQIEGFDVIECYGNSISLNIESRKKDDSVLLSKEYFGVESMMKAFS